MTVPIKIQVVPEATSSFRPKGAPTVTFSYPGVLDSNIESPPWYPTENLTFTWIRVSLLANAGSNHVISLKINGVEYAQYTLPTGSKTMLEAISIDVTPDEPVTIETITVADSEMSIQLWV